MRCTPQNPGAGIRAGEFQRLPSLCAVAALMACLLVAGVRWVAAQANTPGEYEVKAAFLFHFAQFVDWPPEAFKSPGSPLTYCTVGVDPFHGALEAALNGKKFGTRPFRVEHFKQEKEIQGCQVLFIGAVERQRTLAELANVNGNPVLTVGESEHFAQEGGMIGFFLEDNKVRFVINVGAAERANLRISATLLTLAKTVIGGPRGT